MKKTYQLAIENPCHKKEWSSMTDAKKGKFCSICSKNVIDFTTWTDKEIINYLNKADESICGRLDHSQVHRVLTINQPSKIKYWSKIVASVLLLCSASPISAKENSIKESSPSLLRNDDNTRRIDFYTNKLIVNDSIKNSIKGILIKQSSKNPIPDTTIEVEGTDIKTVTDSLGRFQLIIPENFQKEEIVLHVIAGYGFEGETRKIIAKNQLPITDVIIEKPTVLVGEIAPYRREKK